MCVCDRDRKAGFYHFTFIRVINSFGKWIKRAHRSTSTRNKRNRMRRAKTFHICLPLWYICVLCHINNGVSKTLSHRCYLDGEFNGNRIDPRIIIYFQNKNGMVNPLELLLLLLLSILIAYQPNFDLKSLGNHRNVWKKNNLRMQYFEWWFC